jgi:hypothetical protein
VLPAPLLSLVDAWWLPSLLDSGDSHYYCIIYAEVNSLLNREMLRQLISFWPIPALRI